MLHLKKLLLAAVQEQAQAAAQQARIVQEGVRRWRGLPCAQDRSWASSKRGSDLSGSIGLALIFFVRVVGRN